jgi:hypothetical protein
MMTCSDTIFSPNYLAMLDTTGDGQMEDNSVLKKTDSCSLCENISIRHIKLRQNLIEIITNNRLFFLLTFQINRTRDAPAV